MRSVINPLRYSILLVLLLAGFLSCDLQTDEDSASQVVPVSGDEALSDIAEFQEYLNIFDRRRMESITEAGSFYRNRAESVDKTQRDEMFLAFREFYSEIIRQLNEEGTLSVAGYQPGAEENPELQAFRERLYKHGLRLVTGEGRPRIDENPEYLYKIASNYVSEPIKQYLLIRASDLSNNHSQNGMLVVPLEELGERVIRWETYLDKYPDSFFVADARKHYQQYLQVFMSGATHAPVFMPGNKRTLKPEAKLAYEDFVARYTTTRSGQLVREYYTLLEGCNFTWCPAVQTFLKREVTGKIG